MSSASVSVLRMVTALSHLLTVWISNCPALSSPLMYAGSTGRSSSSIGMFCRARRSMARGPRNSCGAAMLYGVFALSVKRMKWVAGAICARVPASAHRKSRANAARRIIY